MDYSVTTIFNQAKILFKRYGIGLCLVLLITALITGVITVLALNDYILEAITMLSQGNFEEASRIIRAYSTNIIWVGTAVFVITLFFNALTTLMACRLTREGGKLSLKHFRLPAVKFLKFAAVNIITSIVVGFGFLFLFIPGIYLMLRLFFAPFYVVDRDDATIGGALAWSWRKTGEHLGDLFVLGLVSTMAVFAVSLVSGLLPFGLGNILDILAQAFVLLAQAATYVTLLDVEKRGLWTNVA